MRSIKRVSGVLLVCLLMAFLPSCGGGGGGGGGGGEGATYYLDADEDGFGDSNFSQVLDGPQDGWVADSTDCDDSASSCTDDCVSNVDGDAIPDCRDRCIDTDLDGYGIDNSPSVIGSGAASVAECTTDGTTPCDGGGETCLDADCDDDPAHGFSVNPGAVEACGDGFDNNCDGLVDCNDSAMCATNLACAACTDVDGDGYLAIDPDCSGGDDCDDDDYHVNPGGVGPFDCPVQLCSACTVDADCGEGNRCIDLDGASVCTAACPDTLCPDGFTCQDIGTGDWQCLPISGSCTCLPEDDGETRPCWISNEYGTCDGVETCDAATGWTGCTAADPEAELCDGLDNDCDPSSADGSEDPLVGAPCDGPDSDLCAEGTNSCSGGVLTCSDNTPGTMDVCDGLDNDCDASSADGSEDPAVGAPCDGPDSDLCEEGTSSCAAGAIVCSDNTPGTLDLCDGQDNDCDESSADGSEDPQVGTACDGPDSDLCKEGTSTCAAGAIVCWDITNSTVDVCNGLDDDCDASSADGSEDPQVGTACDGPDGDLCAEGTLSCSGGALVCSDNTSNTLDICDGINNDCDASSADGSEDPQIDTACDGPDGDLCAEGTLSCSGGALVCSDNTSNTLDICDGINNDCDSSSADGSEDPLVGIPCDGADSDLCAEGTSTCTGGALACTDSTGDTVETCNGADDDCDGETDEGDLCAAGYFCSSGSCQAL